MVVAVTEKRKAQRIPHRAPVTFLVRGTREAKSAISENISTGGIGLIHDSFIPPDTVLMFEVSILSQPFNTAGKVAWSWPVPHSDRYRLGVSFLELDPARRNYLTEYVRLHRHQGVRGKR